MIWTQCLAPPELLEAVERRRKEVFIDKLGWDLTEVSGGRERDQFDGPETLLLVAGEPPVFAMRILSESRCMVRELWPEVAHHITPGSREMSRWVSMRRASLREVRAAARETAAEFRALQWWDMFSITTNRVVRSYRLIGIEPKKVVRFGPDINLCKWNIRTEEAEAP